MLSTIEEHFAVVTDERQQYRVRYPLLNIINHSCWRYMRCRWLGAIEEVGKNKLKLLKQ